MPKSPKQNKKPTNQDVANTPRISYEETQNDEIEVLRSIFMEDFEDVETKTAWSKTAERAFKIRLRAATDTSLFVLLSATFLATYPKTAPRLVLDDSDDLKPLYLVKMRKVLADKSRAMLGEVMIYEITSTLQEILEDAAADKRSDNALPSLEAERAGREAAATVEALKKEEAIVKREQREKDEENRMLQRLLDEELRRRGEKRKKHRRTLPAADAGVSTADYIEFNHDVSWRSGAGKDTTFGSVEVIMKLGEGPVTTAHMVRPSLSGSSTNGVLVVKKVVLSLLSMKKMVLEVEDELEMLKTLQHNNVIGVLDFRLWNEPNGWHLDVLTEYGNKTSLNDMLLMVDIFPVQKARAIFIEILHALDFYHKRGILHNRVHCGNIFLCQSDATNLTVKVSDACYQHTLHQMMLQVDKGATEQPMNQASTNWQPPELIADIPSARSRKSDMWDAGVVLVMILFGLDLPRRVSSPIALKDLSDALTSLTSLLLHDDPRKRPNAFDTLPHEFLRTDAPATRPSLPESRISESSNRMPMIRRESSMLPVSRFASDWVESGRLGRGGYGEVVKARNRLDGRIYAIKKITQKSPAELSQVLSEVYLLATLNHPYVVRYFAAWPEQDSSSETNNGDSTSSLMDSESFHLGTSISGLDFISSSGFPRVKFGYSGDSDDEESEESDGSDDEDDANIQDDTNHVDETKSSDVAAARRSTTTSTLYIQMEYCEKLTLRDIIRRELYTRPDDVWRLLRQILEALVHIHSHGIIHRDLKPENIFIDGANNPRIGDFGLATTESQADRMTLVSVDEEEITRSIGTTLYLAPEIKSTGKGNYSAKVDQYSLGIILFEMCYPLPTAMERHEVLCALRRTEHIFPSDFSANAGRKVEGDIIKSLVSHRPSERPTSTELLRSGMIPVQIEDETIRLALQGMSDNSSPYYQKMMAGLFAQSSFQHVRDQMWDMHAQNNVADQQRMLVLQDVVRGTIVDCFKRHGAVEEQRPILLPVSGYSTIDNVVKLLDQSGTVVQLPYDLTLPYARCVAKHGAVFEKTFAFGSVYRQAPAGAAPYENHEVDFDIVTIEGADEALQEAEVLKVVDEILDEIPSIASAQMCYHINHSSLLELILDFVKVPVSQRPAVKEILSRLNIHHWTWQKIRLELRVPAIALSASCLNELERFDFRDTCERCLTQLQEMFTGTPYMARLYAIFSHLSSLVEYLNRLGVKRKIFCSPLSNFNDRYYRGGVMFQCLFDTKKRDVLAAGGRYDHLVTDHQNALPNAGAQPKLHAVGTKIAWDRLTTSMLRYHKHAGSKFLKKIDESEEQSRWIGRRCDVLVAASNPVLLRSLGLKLVADLWANDISAELTAETHSTEELYNRHRDERHSFHVMVRHEAGATSKPELRVRNVDREKDIDLRSSDLLTFIRAELQDRSSTERSRLARQSSHSHDGGPRTPLPQGDVQVLLASHKSKKTNKWRMVEAAHVRVKEMVESLRDGPVVSVEMSEELFDSIRETRLSQPDSWRKVVQSAPLADRQYVQEVQQMVARFKEARALGIRNCFIYNFKTGGCICYDYML